MEPKFELLDTEAEKDTVLAFISPVAMFKLHELFLAVKNAFGQNGMETLANNLKSRGSVAYTWDRWTSQGIDCEILKPASGGWKKGKIKLKISLEFCPEKPEFAENPLKTSSESTLDDIRNMNVHRS